MQAILITAYKDKEQLQKLIKFFDLDFLVYIHLDKKSNLKSSDFIINENVTIIKKYKITWGGINHLYAILDLLKLALNDQRVKYVHIISGQDIPIKSKSEFRKFDHCNKIFMETEPLNKKSVYFKKRVTEGTLFSNTDSRKKYIKIINKIYGCLHKPPYCIDAKIWIGLVWCSFPRTAAQIILNYISKNNFMFWKHVRIPEEFFFQTVLENSFLKDFIVNNNLRYNIWHKKNGTIPAILDDKDFKNIKLSDDFFARKVDSVISKSLINMISENINQF